MIAPATKFRVKTLVVAENFTLWLESNIPTCHSLKSIYLEIFKTILPACLGCEAFFFLVEGEESGFSIS